MKTTEFVLLLELEDNEFIVATEPTTDHAALCRVGDELLVRGIGYIICSKDDISNYIGK